MSFFERMKKINLITVGTKVLAGVALATRTSTNTHSVSTTIQQVNLAAGETSELSKKVHTYADEIAGQLTILLEETTMKLQQVQEHDGENKGSKQKLPQSATVANRRIAFPDRRTVAQPESQFLAA